MKVYIGDYVEWFGPYQLAELLMFWCKDEDRVHNFGEKLSSIKWLDNFLNWVYSKKKRITYIKVDSYDTYNVDHTIALLITPLLKQFKEKTYGSPRVDEWDVPEHLRPSSEEIDLYQTKGEIDSKYHERWQWVLGEMIFAFEDTLLDEDHLSSSSPEEKAAEKAKQARVANGFALFGKYYQGLWS